MTRLLILVLAATVTTAVAQDTTARDTTAAAPSFSDSFDGPSLNAGLGERQNGALAPVEWVHRPGVWADAPNAPPSTTVLEEGHLVFLANAALRLDRALTPDAQNQVRVAMRLDPAVGDTASLTWMSLMLTPEPTSLAWVTTPDHTVSMYLRSNGEVHILSRGITATVLWQQGPPTPADSYVVDVTLGHRSDGLYLVGTIGGHAFTAPLGEGSLPRTLYASIGAHFHARERSSLDFVHVWSGD